MRVSELTGHFLDYWVARAEAREVEIVRQGPPSAVGPEYYVALKPTGHVYRPSHSWVAGGPIIQRENIFIGPNLPVGGVDAGYEWLASFPKPGGLYNDRANGPTPLVAAMRAFVTSKFGEIVPDQ